jgi:AhpD family alkylhydroperoxidase
MPTVRMVEYEQADEEVRAVYEDIMATRRTDAVTPYWKTIAHHPATLKRTWEQFKATVAGGALDPLTKEMLYIAVSVTNRCDYCIEAHTRAARALGMTEAMLGELMAVVALANGAN